MNKLLFLFLTAFSLVLGGHIANAQTGRLVAPAAPADNPMAYQPFGVSPQLPPGYKPSPSAIDPPESAAPSPNHAVPTANSDTESNTEATDSEALLPHPDVIVAQPDPRNYIAVKLQGLDKVTARRQQFKAMMGTVTSFGNLEIVPRACWQSPAEQKPDSAALLEIWQWKPGEKPSFVFFGWMFSASPGLSALEHPIYDISVLQCIPEKQNEKQPSNTEKETSDTPNAATTPTEAAPLLLPTPEELAEPQGD